MLFHPRAFLFELTATTFSIGIKESIFQLCKVKKFFAYEILASSRYRKTFFQTLENETFFFICAFFFPETLCPQLNVSDVELESRLEGRRVGNAAIFSCPDGFAIKSNGSDDGKRQQQQQRKITCLKNGSYEKSLFTKTRKSKYLATFFSLHPRKRGKNRRKKVTILH